MDAPAHSHFKLYKPYGYVSQFTTNDSKARNKKFLGEFFDFPEGIMPIGRLDEPSEGLLLLTTNGKLSHYMNSRHIEKEYYAQLDGAITTEALTQLQQGVPIGLHGATYTTKHCKVTQLAIVPELPPRAKKIRDDRHGPTSWISIILTEGKFRQVRKMTAAVGFATLRLVRVRVGEITITHMKAGEVQEIQLEDLYNPSVEPGVTTNGVNQSQVRPKDTRGK